MLGDFFVSRKRCAFREPDFHHDFGTAGIRENCCCTSAHAHNTQGKGQGREANGDPAVLHAPIHQPPKGGEKGLSNTSCGSSVMPLLALGGLHMGRHLEQQRAQVRHEAHRHHPRQHQRNHRHRKIAKVYSPVIDLAMPMGKSQQP